MSTLKLPLIVTLAQNSVVIMRLKGLVLSTSITKNDLILYLLFKILLFSVSFSIKFSFSMTFLGNKYATIFPPFSWNPNVEIQQYYVQKLKMNTMSFKTILMTSLPKDVSLYLIIAISFILFKKRGQFGIYKRHCVQPLNHCIAIEAHSIITFFFY